MAQRPSQSTNPPDRSEDKSSPNPDMSSWRPGSEPEKAADIGATGDFGVHESGSRRDREYVSRNTKASDPGNSQPYGWEQDGVRDHGAGARNSGPGSGSAGDVDTDIVGVGAGGSTLAATAPGESSGPDDSDGSSNEFASPVPPTNARAIIEPASGRNQTGVGRHGATSQVGGNVVMGPDVSSGDEAQGADAATNPQARDDDAFTGEISTGEARGEDNARSQNP